MRSLVAPRSQGGEAAFKKVGAVTPIPITANALRDNLWSAILRRAAPWPGVSVTSRALAMRKTYLAGCPPHACAHEADLTKQWRSGLARADVPETLMDTPFWRNSPEAEALYRGILVEQAGLRAVCKRWRAVQPIRIAICGVGDQLPHTVETVILAVQRPSEARADLAEQCKHLAELPRLRTLVIWLLAPCLRPPLPASPCALHHLSHHAPHPASASADEAILQSVRKQPELRTRSLPDSLVGAGEHSRDSFVLARAATCLPRLETVGGACIAGLSLADVSQLSSLRCLAIQAAPGFHGNREAVYACDQLEAPPLLHSLTLDVATHGSRSPDLCNVASLSALTHLHLRSAACNAAVWAQIASAPALESLELTEGNVVLPGPRILAPLSRLTKLSIEGLNARHVNGLAAMTRLANLRLHGVDMTRSAQWCLSSAYFDGVQGLLFPSSLTRLELAQCLLAPGDIATLARLMRLQRLHCTDVTFMGAMREDLVEDLEDMFQSMAALEDVTLEGDSEVLGAALAAAGADCLTRIKRLRCAGMVFRSTSKQELMTMLRDLAAIEELDLQHCAGDCGDTIAEVQLSTFCPALKALAIRSGSSGCASRCPVSTAKLAWWQWAQTLGQRRPASTHTKMLIHELAQLPRLESVKLDDFVVYKGAVRSLSRSKTMRRLELHRCHTDDLRRVGSLGLQVAAVS